VALEAVSSGLLAVVSDIGGCRDIVELSGGGLVARAGDVDDFFDRCRELLDSSDTLERQRKKGLAYAERQSWSAVNGALIDAYKAMIS